MKYVIDASIGFKWMVIEPLTAKARQLRDDFRSAVHELIAPDLFPTEIGNAIAVAERRGRIPAGQGALLLRDLLNMLPAIHPALPDLLPRAYAISAQTQQSVYDCLYVALAERERCALITADDRLVRNLQRSSLGLRLWPRCPDSLAGREAGSDLAGIGKAKWTHPRR